VALSEDKKSNYVIQKLIQMSSRIISTSDQADVKDRLMAFMRDTADALCGKLRQLATHQSASRIVQCLISHFPRVVEERMVKALVACFDAVVKDIYGTTVLQEALKTLKSEHLLEAISLKLETRTVDLAADHNSSVFLETCLDVSRLRKVLLAKLLGDQQTLPALLRTSNSFFVLKKLVDACDDEQLQRLDHIAADHREALVGQSFGGDFLVALRERLARGRGDRQDWRKEKEREKPAPRDDLPQRKKRSSSRGNGFRKDSRDQDRERGDQDPRERNRDRDQGREKVRERERERSRDKPRDRDRDREKSRDRRDRRDDRYPQHDKDRDRDRDRDRDWERERDKDRDSRDRHQRSRRRSRSPSTSSHSRDRPHTNAKYSKTRR
jgi:hypothetical protein